MGYKIIDGVFIVALSFGFVFGSGLVFMGAVTLDGIMILNGAILDGIGSLGYVGLRTLGGSA